MSAVQKTLCLDFGNTRLKCAVFENRELAEVIILDNDNIITFENLTKHYSPQKTILASVIEHNPEIENYLSHHTKFHKLSAASKLPFAAVVSKPESIGADRLALAAGAVHLYPKQHSLIIGLGSCITYNFINKFQEFLGGSISPGLEMRFRAMHEFTVKLPLVSADVNFPLIGYDTKTNMVSGAVLGMTKEIEGIIDEYNKRYSNFNAVLTGGDMALFAPHLKKKIFADSHLIYKGLYAISEINN